MGYFFGHTLIKAAHLSSRIRRRGSSFVSASVSSSASSTTCGGGQVSVSRRQAAGARYCMLAVTERGEAWMALRWRIGGADRRLAPRPCVASLLPPSTLPLRARGTILHGLLQVLFLFHLLFHLFGCAIPPVAASRDASITEGQARAVTVSQNGQSSQAQGEVQGRA
jgi:hypothetical protein